MSRRPIRPDIHAAVRASRRATYREAILEAAEKAFTELGFANTKMSDVSDAAGVAIGTLYNYFENKEELFCALLERGKSNFFAVIEEVEQRENDPLSRLEAIVSATFDYLQEHGPMFAVAVQVLGGPPTDPRFDFQARQRYVDKLSECIHAAVVAGTLRSDIPVMQMAVSLEGMMSAHIRSWIVDGECGLELTKSSQAVYSLFVDGAEKP